MATKPSRLTLKRAIEAGLRLPLACQIGLQGLQREGHAVYVLPPHAGGSRFPLYLVVELRGASSLDPAALCPEALIVRDGTLVVAYADHEQFHLQHLDWDRRRWVGRPGDKTLEAPVVDVQLWPQRHTAHGALVYWTVQRSVARASTYNEDPLRKYAWSVHYDGIGGRDQDRARGYLEVATGRLWTRDMAASILDPQRGLALEPDGSPLADPDFQRAARIAIAATHYAHDAGWSGVRGLARANPARSRAPDWFAHHLSHGVYRVSDRDAAALARDARAPLPRPGYELAVELPNGTPAWLARSPHGTRPGGGWAYVWSVTERGGDRSLREQSEARDRARGGGRG